MMACYYMHSLRYCHLNVESSGFVIFLGVIWVLQETTDIRILRYIILFIGKCNSALFLSVLFSEVYCNASCVSDEESQLNNCRCDEQLVFSSGYGFWKKFFFSWFSPCEFAVVLLMPSLHVWRRRYLWWSHISKSSLKWCWEICRSVSLPM